MRIPGYILVGEAASRLGVTEQRVRQLVAEHGLAAQRVGRVLMVREDDVSRRVSLSPSDGRRLTPSHAWALLAIASGIRPGWLDAQARYRLRRLLAERGLRGLESRLTDRASLPRSYRAHSSLMDRVREANGLMLSGVSAAAPLGLGLFGGPNIIEGYVDERELDAFVARWTLRPSADPNLIVRVIPAFTSPAPFGHVAPRAAVALDLFEHEDPRARQVGDELLKALEA
jgi:excisionase family DNA binding protein